MHRVLLKTICEAPKFQKNFIRLSSGVVNMETHGVVPDVVSTVPKHTLQVSRFTWLNL